jgi:acylphosphatase
MEEKVRAHAAISGKVQGVFFRMETKNTADSYGVTGWVRNRSDGSVEAVFEGDRQNVKKVIDWCKRGPTFSRVEEVDVQWEDGIKGHNMFEITY